MEFLRREWFWYGIRGSRGGWESEIREAKGIIGAVVVAVGLGRAVVAGEIGEAETAVGAARAVAAAEFSDGGGGGCSTEIFVAGGLMVLVGCRRHRHADDDREEPQYYPPPAVAVLAVVVTLLHPLTWQALHCGALLHRHPRESQRRGRCNQHYQQPRSCLPEG